MCTQFLISISFGICMMVSPGQLHSHWKVCREEDKWNKWIIGLFQESGKWQTSGRASGRFWSTQHQAFVNLIRFDVACCLSFGACLFCPCCTKHCLRREETNDVETNTTKDFLLWVYDVLQHLGWISLSPLSICLLISTIYIQSLPSISSSFHLSIFHISVCSIYSISSINTSSSSVEINQ